MGDGWIEVRDLAKTYRVSERAPGLGASLKSLARKTYREVPAVRGVSFRIEPGEMVGFIGPNGAGKTTTLKMLAGLLHPSAGTAQVAGFTPWERAPAYLRRIAMVLGNKSQLMWDIPAQDTFRVLGEIYGVPPAERRETVAALSGLLALEGLLHRPVRNLSLGERMKCELVAALLHRPAVLFLDEPTLGLDVSMQRRLRGFMKSYNRSSGATVILTSHYMADVAELCERVLLIHRGRLRYDGPLAALSAQLAPFRLIRLTTRVEATTSGGLLPESAQIVSRENGRWTLRVPREATAAVTAALLESLSVVDLVVEDPPLDAVIEQVYQGGMGR